MRDGTAFDDVGGDGSVAQGQVFDIPSGEGLVEATGAGEVIGAARKTQRDARTARGKPFDIEIADAAVALEAWELFDATANASRQ